MHDMFGDVRPRARGHFGFPVPRSMRLVLLLLAVMLLLRALLPQLVQWYVNQALDASPAYEGSVGDVDLHLYRGAYSVRGVSIRKLEGEVPVPLFTASRVEFSLLWRALMRGAMVASIEFHAPNIHIVDSAQEENRQTGVEGSWLNLLEHLAPTRIDRVRIHDGSLHFHNFEVEREVNVYISELDVVATNLTNSKALSRSMVGEVEGSGQVKGAGSIDFAFNFDPDSRYPTFDFAGRIREVPLVALDDLIEAYAPFDVESGILSMTSELSANDGNVTGYVKPLITNLEIFDWQADVVEGTKNPFRIIWEGAVDIVAELFENQEKDQLATLVEIEGRFDDPETNNWVVFVNMLKNAFIEAYNLDYESLTPEAGQLASSEGASTAEG